MFEILACVALLPIAAWKDVSYWFNRARQRATPRECELAIASHGAGFLAVAALAVWIAGPAEFPRFLLDAPAAFPADWMHWLPALAFAVAVVLGVLWLSSGTRRALAWAGYRDSRLIALALFKIALGVGVWLLFWHPPASWPRDVLAWLVAARTISVITRACIMALVAWLLVTGLTKLLLVSWPRFGSARGAVDDDIAGQEFDWDN